ncbi:unnamed protein product [Rotaria sordida]|uniref:ATP-dependent DNA helicase n=1 Tax=Rotaria sordida TaxID=392033 RepID=A0A814M748_9BILA|nr:unnamed protein product [Rotaria sordida]CAF1539911.1 unnamed protein product [Rotaria sordida]
MPVKKRASLGRSTSAARRMAATRAAEDSEDTRIRLDGQRARQAASRAAEDSEDTRTRLDGQRARQAASIAAESPERRQGRREEDRARHAATRGAEDPIQRRTRSEDQRRRQAASRAAQWTFMEGEAFRYDPANNYDSHPQLYIGQMSAVCPYCNALKWHAETRALRTVNGQICATFREACQLHGLLEDDQQWDATMSEAAAAQSPARLRNLFALILAVCGPSNPKQLWESYKESLTEDILRNARRRNPGMNLDYTPDMFNQALIIIENKVLEMGGKELEKLELPTPQRNSGDRLNSAMLRETSYDVKELDAYITANEPLITKGTGEVKVLQECELIAWDECTMAHRYALEALNHTLQDLRNNGKNMGGVVVLIAGDFRQTLPVIPKGTMADELKACLKSSYLWRHVASLKLSSNMRVHLQGDVSAGRFAEQLLAIGNGKIPADPVSGLINISDNFCNIVESVEELKNKVFPNIQTQYKDHKWLCERAILAPKNVNVNAINLQIQQQLPGEAISYKSIDTVKDIDMVVQYPTEFLNSLEPSGMPPHNLRLKIGSSIMLLRNLDAPRLCNGTRLCVKTLMPHVIEATIMTGCAKGEDVFIPKIPLLPSDIPFQFTRLQFPVRLAFAMSINKAQGQSLKVAGVNLETPCFSHGQLYVACSRVGTGENLYVFAPDGKTKNIVYKTALQ